MEWNQNSFKAYRNVQVIELSIDVAIYKNKELAIAAMWLGIGTHLLKGSTIHSGSVKALFNKII